ncbi:MAG: hypothetical protein DRP37_00405 [Thermodesulfobacteriota bacterium]|nr:MAG: hypothetical protein DRP37_00405 [Thermodesulfobacteriota bacterium]
MKATILLLITVFFLGGCATTGQSQQSLKTHDMRECAQNFTYDGNFWIGRTYKTHVFIKGISKELAMERAARYTINDGWSITNTDNNLGIISASQTVSYGQGKTVPMNVGIESTDGGVKISMTYSTQGGVTSPLDSIKNHFCSTIEAVKGK